MKRLLLLLSFAAVIPLAYAAPQDRAERPSAAPISSCVKRWDPATSADHAGAGAGLGNDSLVGIVDLTIVLLQNTGGVDPVQYTWKSADVDTFIARTNRALKKWETFAKRYNRPLTIRPRYVRPDSIYAKIPYDPMLHSSAQESLWVGTVMTKMGYIQGTYQSRVKQFNDNTRNSYGSNWATMCFVVYNPDPAPKSLTDGYSSYAYLGGPFFNVLYRNDAPVQDIGDVVAHEMAHNFWAVDEYQISGCSMDDPMNGTPRPYLTNINCQNGNPSPVPCLMNLEPADDICASTAAQVGIIPRPNLSVIISDPPGIPLVTGSYNAPSPARIPLGLGQSLRVAARQQWSVERNPYAFTAWSDMAGGVDRKLTPISTVSETLIVKYDALPGSALLSSVVTGDHGLLGPVIKQTLTDSKGYRWVSGDGGVAVWKGNSWSVYNSSLGTLNDSYVHGLALRSDGTLLAAGFKGFHSFNGSVWSDVTVPAGFSFATNILIGPGDTLWLTGLTGGVAKGFKGTWTVYPAVQFPHQQFRRLVRDASGGIWVTGTTGAASVYRNGVWKHYPSIDTATTIYIDQIYASLHHGVWFATSNGAYQFQDGTFRRWELPGVDGYPSAEVNCLIVDSLGNLYYNQGGTWNFYGTYSVQGGLNTLTSSGITTYPAVKHLPTGYGMEMTLEGKALLMTMMGGLVMMDVSDNVKPVSAPAPPSTITAAKSGIPGDSSVVFRWSRSATSLQYIAEIATDSLFAGKVKRFALTDTTLTFTPGSGVQYYLRIAGENHVDTGLFGKTFAFNRNLTGVHAPDASPMTFGLEQNFPNPFNPATAIGYQLSAEARTTLIVFDIVGREVATLVNDVQSAGSYTVRWDASRFASGPYFLRLQSGDHIQWKRMLLLK